MLLLRTGRVGRRLLSTRSVSSLFDAAKYQTTRLPLEAARTLPSHVFHSAEWNAAEVRHLLTPTWTLVGRVDELPHAGSFMRLDVPGGASSIIVRGKDKQIRAWANVCPHRGAALTDMEAGRFAGGIVCPYHAWTFDPTSGALRGVSRKDGMSSCFDKAEWPLRAMRLAEYRGFLFVSASDDTPPLEEMLGNAPSLVLSDWPFEDFETVGRREYVVECNWKFLMQNTSETYHTSFVHRDSLGPMPSEPISTYRGVAPVGNWDAVHVPSERSIVPLPGEAAPFPELPTCSTTFFVSLFPTLQLNLTRDCAWWMRVLPDGPTRSRVTMGFLFPKATAALPDFNTHLDAYLYRWDLAVTEDNDISVNQQKATVNPFHRPGPYHALEFAVHRFDNMVLDAVLGGEAHEPAADGDGPATLAMAASALAARKSNLLAQPVAQAMRGAHTRAQGHIRASSGDAASGFSLAPGASVCVTGASGFIALHLVEQLLTAGYRVTAAVRTDDPTKLAPLTSLSSLGELTIVAGCDLLKPGSFDGAVADASAVFHTASPFWMDSRITDPWEQVWPCTDSPPTLRLPPATRL